MTNYIVQSHFSRLCCSQNSFQAPCSTRRGQDRQNLWLNTSPSSNRRSLASPLLLLLEVLSKVRLVTHLISLTSLTASAGKPRMVHCLCTVQVGELGAGLVTAPERCPTTPCCHMVRSELTHLSVSFSSLCACRLYSYFKSIHTKRFFFKV